MNKKIIAGALASVMAVASAAVVSADQVTADKTYEGGLVVDGTAAWNSAGSGDTYVITEDGVTVTFNNEPFIDAKPISDTNAATDENWDNFVFETIATDAAAGISLRADAFGWTYGDNTSNVPTWEVTTSWGDDWAGAFKAAAPGKVELTAKKASADTVTFSILFHDGATEVYTVTYPAGVPEGLEFQVGADGGKITLQSVKFAGTASNTTEEDKTPDNTTGANGGTDGKDEGDKNTPNSGIEGVAVVAGLAIVAAGAVVVAKKRK